jgi:uncharacterized SAM-binding protein YcdF (DUF218 family)
MTERRLCLQGDEVQHRCKQEKKRSGDCAAHLPDMIKERKQIKNLGSPLIRVIFETQVKNTVKNIKNIKKQSSTGEG